MFNVDTALQTISFLQIRCRLFQTHSHKASLAEYQKGINSSSISISTRQSVPASRVSPVCLLPRLVCPLSGREIWQPEYCETERCYFGGDICITKDTRDICTQLILSVVNISLPTGSCFILSDPGRLHTFCKL